MMSKEFSIHFEDIVDAIQSKDLKSIKRFLKKKEVPLVGYQELSVLHLAARWGDAETLRILLEDKRVSKLINHQMYNGDTPILSAAKYGNISAAGVLIDCGAKMEKKKAETGDTVLHFAAHLGDSELMNMLLTRNTSQKFINTSNLSGETALEVALKEHSPTVQLLLQAGADYSKPNFITGRNVLHTSVAYNQCGVVHELLVSSSSRKLSDLTDHRGDTPLMLAIRLACMECVIQLSKQFKPGLEINKLTQESILHMAVMAGEEDVLKQILMLSDDKLLNHRDPEGMTPLLLAVEQFKDNCLERLVKSRNIYSKSTKSQETALHVALRVDNRFALSMFFQIYKQATLWCISQKNRKGTTPFWMAIEIGHASFIVEARKRGWADVEEVNKYGDTTVFVAASCGHLKVLKALLLSERYYEFCREHEKDTDLIEGKLIRNAEICCDIYTTDIFILTNSTRKNKFHTWVPKVFLSSENSNGRNVFHACALGGNILCLDFVYSLCNLFDFGMLMFDSPDIKGNTPLLLATKNDLGGPKCVYFFLSKGANVSSYNDSGDCVLKSLVVYTEESIEIMETVLNEGVTYEQSSERGLQESEYLQVDFSLLKPPNEPVTKVVKLFYNTIHGPQRAKLLQHSLFKIYIHLILSSVSYFFFCRFALSCLTTLLLTLYVIVYSCNPDTLTTKPLIMKIIYCSLFVLSLLGILFAVPLLFNENICCLTGILTYSLMLLPCLMTFILIFFSLGPNFAFDISALTVLVSCFSLMMYSTAVFKEISHQIAMLSHVIIGMMIYFRIVFLVLLPFSLAFYCIFNDLNYFINPLKSFLYTGFILLQGDTITSFQYFESKHFYKSYTKAQLNSSASRRPHSSSIVNELDFCFESVFLIIFIITCVLGLLNMLVGLAVSGKTLPVDGEIFRSHLQIRWLSSLEEFLNSFFYQVLLKSRLIYLFGIIPSRTLFKIKTKYSSMVDKKSDVFSKDSIIELKKCIGKSMKKNSLTTFSIEWLESLRKKISDQSEESTLRRSVPKPYDTDQI